MAETNTNEVNSLLVQGFKAAKEGRRDEAYNTFCEVVNLDHNNEHGWLYRAATTDDLSEAYVCLQRVLSLNPNNTKAVRGMDRIRARMTEEAHADNKAEGLAEQPYGANDSVNEESDRVGDNEVVSGFGVLPAALNEFSEAEKGQPVPNNNIPENSSPYATPPFTAVPAAGIYLGDQNQFKAGINPADSSLRPETNAKPVEAAIPNEVMEAALAQDLLRDSLVKRNRKKEKQPSPKIEYDKTTPANLKKQGKKSRMGILPLIFIVLILVIVILGVILLVRNISNSGNNSGNATSIPSAVTIVPVTTQSVAPATTSAVTTAAITTAPVTTNSATQATGSVTSGNGTANIVITGISSVVTTIPPTTSAPTTPPATTSATTVSTNPGSAAVVRPILYTVKTSDNLTNLAKTYNTSIEAIVAANSNPVELGQQGPLIGTAPNYILYANTRLVIPVQRPDFKGKAVIIKTGETMDSIAARYKVAVADILKLNGLASSTDAKPGEPLLVP